MMIPNYRKVLREAAAPARSPSPPQPFAAQPVAQPAPAPAVAPAPAPQVEDATGGGYFAAPVLAGAMTAVPFAVGEAGKREAAKAHAQELLEQAKHHLAEATRLHDLRVKETPPTHEHHKTNIGIYLTSLALSALDPTHQAGAQFLGSYQGAKNQRETEANQDRLNAFNSRQAGLAAEAQGEQQQGSAYLTQSQEAQREEDQREQHLLDEAVRVRNADQSNDTRLSLGEGNLNLRGRKMGDDEMARGRKMDDDEMARLQKRWDSLRDSALKHLEHGTPTEQLNGRETLRHLFHSPEFEPMWSGLDPDTVEKYEKAWDAAAQKPTQDYLNSVAKVQKTSADARKANAQADVEKAVKPYKIERFRSAAKLNVVRVQQLQEKLKAANLLDPLRAEQLQTNIARGAHAMTLDDAKAAMSVIKSTFGESEKAIQKQIDAEQLAANNPGISTDERNAARDRIHQNGGLLDQLRAVHKGMVDEFNLALSGRGRSPSNPNPEESTGKAKKAARGLRGDLNKLIHGKNGSTGSGVHWRAP